MKLYAIVISPIIRSLPHEPQYYIAIYTEKNIRTRKLYMRISCLSAMACIDALNAYGVSEAYWNLKTKVID